MNHDLPAGCADRTCAGDCARAALTRRTFLALGASGIGAATVDPWPAAAKPRPAEPPSRAELSERGSPTEYTGAALARIGMPVGGGCAGQVFLAGDGRLWAWDILNPTSFPLGGAEFSGSNYADPLSADQPGATRFDQGLALRTETAGEVRTVRLDGTGFRDVRFTGQYPIGRVRYADPDSPVEVALDAYSPFVPLEVDDSTLPATILEVTVRNPGPSPVEVSLLGYAANPVCLDSRRHQPTRLRAAGFDRGIEFTAVDDHSAEGDDILFEDWESDGFGDWQVGGTAFGDGPVTQAELPNPLKRFGDLNLSGTRFVTSYRLDSDRPDAATGSLTSREFTVERRYVAVALGGGDRPGEVGVEVIIDGAVVASATGEDREPMITRFLDLGDHRGRTARIRIFDESTDAWGHIGCDAIWFTDNADIVFEDWENGYADWTVEGTAFGAGPVTPGETPDGFRRPFGLRTELNVRGRFVTSYHFRADDGRPDAHTGSLTSREFTIERRYVTAWVGGGSHRGETGLEVIVDGEVVAAASGTDIEPLTAVSLDVGRFRGRQAKIMIVDRHTGDWGHVNVDRILFSDRPVRRLPVPHRPDGGSFAVAALDADGAVRPAVTVRRDDDGIDPDSLFDGPDGPAETEGDDGGPVGTVTVRFTLPPGQQRRVRHGFGWYFPNPQPDLFAELVDGPRLRREYSRRFDSARDVLGHLTAELDRLSERTREWVRTWYEDSTLPHWFLERTLATASTLATMTCHRFVGPGFDGARFYAWEGTYCCAGTCQHVWSYAQAIARLFPELERDTRERVDLGIAFRETGEIGNRGEAGDAASSFADGQCGTILRFYREHQTSPDTAFLERNWAKIKKSVEFVITARDGADGDEIDGIFRGSQWNTLDTEWFGEVPWLSGLYVAALRAAAELAGEAGDDAAAERYTGIAERGSKHLRERLFDADLGYFVQRTDPDHPSVNSNRGCHIDQLYGQTYAAQLGLPRVFDAEQARSALGRIHAHNFLADPPSHRPPGVDPGRVYATANEPGVIMTSWPHGGSEESGRLMYFNEVWTGQEYQFAAHLFAEGMVAEGLAVTRAVYDRYHGSKRNPYNEVEASDHYARAMMGFGVYLAALGYEHHGPRGHLGFAPRIGSDDFRGAFPAAEGWGSYRQTRRGRRLVAELELRHGSLRLSSLALVPKEPPTRVTVHHGGRRLPAELDVAGDRALVTLAAPVRVRSGERLRVELT
ncbi:MAG TPA: GH116 family glycosyl hydrolase [Microlunatus sp.]|nr:GH116 family glycosyl hydrolase [Microlunatus sp.]